MRSPVVASQKRSEYSNKLESNWRLSKRHMLELRSSVAVCTEQLQYVTDMSPVST